MRDIRKNSEYFTAYLEYQYSRIEKKFAKLRESIDNESKRQRILVSMTNYEINLLKAEFSDGASRDNMKILLIRAIDIVKDYKNPTHEDIVILLSMAIMLGIENDAKKLVENNAKKIADDRLLKCLATYVKDGSIEWDESLTINDAYVGLNEVFSSKNKEVALLNYLGKWYEARKEFAWYNTHLSDSDTYCGYWSFESGAISKMLKLKEDVLSQSVYFPVL